jgi:antirestriction protein ArdC
MEQKRIYEVVAERIIEQLKKGTAPWQKPWDSTGNEMVLPYNAVTNKSYRGLNSLYLHLFSPYSDPRWSTFKQAESQGWQVKKGAKGMAINFVKTHDLIPKRDKNGKTITDENGKPIKVRVELAKPIVTKAWVFNAEQINGVPELPKTEAVNLWEKVERADKIVRESGARVEHVAGDRAFYAPLQDKIQMPERGQFKTADRFYATLLHELGHWTGHKDRLNRDLLNKFGSEEYAKEELRAEIASMMVGAELKIRHDPEQHVAYVDSWIKILTDTPFEIHAAAADAQKIFDYTMAFEKRSMKQGLNQAGHSIEQQAEGKVKDTNLQPVVDQGYKIGR